MTSKRTIILEPLPAAPSRVKKLWWWLTSSRYRQQQEFIHPLLFLWRVLWFIPLTVVLLVYCLMLCIAYGPEQAKITFWEAGV